MTYTAQTWADGPDGGTPITAARLTHIEAGVLAASAAAEGLTVVDNGDGTVTVGGTLLVDNGDGTFAFSAGGVTSYTKAGADAHFSTGGGGGAGTVTQVAGVNPDGSGHVALTADNIGDGTTNKAYTATEKTKLGAITGSNTGDQTITLTGDATGSGTGSFATTLATVATPGTTGDAAHSLTVTVDAKGRVTSVTSNAIAIPESAVTNLTTDLAAKAPLYAANLYLAANYR